MSVAIVLGTRPEIIKLSPIIRQLEGTNSEYIVIHTGQHYSKNLDTVFFEDLNIPTPDYNLSVGSGPQSKQTGEMMAEIGAILREYEPDTVIVQGDTNSTLSGGLVASKLHSDLVHVEAGLRSNDRSMPEEVNRILVDHAADYLFPPTNGCKENLVDEGISTDKIFVTGNTVVDAVQKHVELARETQPLGLATQFEEYVLLTAHRAKNVDSKDRFASILTGADKFARDKGLEIIYPIHPRGRNKIDEFGIDIPPTIELIDPVGYLDFLQLEVESQLIITDSGGVQEEACILGTPCVTVRDSTERPETIDVGANILAGSDSMEIVAASKAMYNKKADWKNPFGNGNAAERIVSTIENQ